MSFHFLPTAIKLLPCGEEIRIRITEFERTNEMKTKESVVSDGSHKGTYFKQDNIEYKRIDITLINFYRTFVKQNEHSMIESRVHRITNNIAGYE